MADEEKDGDAGFKVVDRRHFDTDGSVRTEEEAAATATAEAPDAEAAEDSAPKAAEAQPSDAAPDSPSAKPPPTEKEAPSPPAEAEGDQAGYHVGESPDGHGELDFAQFLLGVAQLAFAFLGDLPNPQTGLRERNVAAAKQQIDLLLLLREKTQGNLTPQEENLLGSILYDLQIRFVDVVRGRPGPEGGNVG